MHDSSHVSSARSRSASGEHRYRSPTEARSHLTIVVLSLPHDCSALLTEQGVGRDTQIMLCPSFLVPAPLIGPRDAAITRQSACPCRARPARLAQRMATLGSLVHAYSAAVWAAPRGPRPL